MRYYLVALFDKQSYSYMEEIQRTICKKYKIYKNMPMLHITLEVIGDPDMEKLTKIVSDMLKPYKKFKVEVNGAICFDPPYKSVNLKIENKGYIIRLARQINDTLKLHGFDVRDNISKWDLHVSLANTNYAAREWSAKEYIAACESTKKEDIHRMAKIDRIELWKPINSRRDMVVKSFPLRDF
ncbi:AKAP7 2'5' RNA ligase-like domain-containing protein [Clostridium sp. CX1]|uniref:2'-5' RNA ligase family protein n=1 Tax=Clostridium tanneri TaxID=3037988 RepID=A0ABU4JU07_9CLOT|nr:MULTISPECIES: AKAP7 2'5' RNA ligase-like domain-containing protein [unclassified Clostridium]MCT8977525.1 AKAP7 2'5' RNA ligase-like domain-containing protein [Clostridium sp. CX1]MDW8801641.1 2'-5' RNA ligase family protein [Clostridium sp. A1-XYC3]